MFLLCFEKNILRLIKPKFVGFFSRFIILRTYELFNLLQKTRKPAVMVGATGFLFRASFLLVAASSI